MLARLQQGVTLGLLAAALAWAALFASRGKPVLAVVGALAILFEIGRASCRERVCLSV